MAEKKPPEAESPKPPEPVERRATWPDPAKMNFDPDSPDKYRYSLRVDDKPKRRRTD